MKKVIYFLTAILLVLASCDPMAEIYDEMEEMDTDEGWCVAVESLS